MDYKEEMFKLLGVEEKEPFELQENTRIAPLDEHRRWRINETLDVETQKRGEVSWHPAKTVTLQDILLKNVNIKRIPKEPQTKEDKLICAYAKLCGCLFSCSRRGWLCLWV